VSGVRRDGGFRCQEKETKKLKRIGVKAVRAAGTVQNYEPKKI
jgi:hypothetical protein